MLTMDMSVFHRVFGIFIIHCVSFFDVTQQMQLIFRAVTGDFQSAWDLYNSDLDTSGHPDNRNFHFKHEALNHWADYQISSVVVTLIVRNKIVANFTFVPGRSSTKSSWFSAEKLLNTSYLYNITTAEYFTLQGVDQYFEVLSNEELLNTRSVRSFYIATHFQCPGDEIYLAVFEPGRFGALCDYEKWWLNRTVILYSRRSFTAETASKNYKDMIADFLEIHVDSIPVLSPYSPLNISNEDEQWVLLLRYKSGSKISLFSIWQDPNYLGSYTNHFRNYRNPVIDSWPRISVTKVKLNVIRNGFVVAYYVFNASVTTANHWFQSDRLLHSSHDSTNLIAKGPDASLFVDFGIYSKKPVTSCSFIQDFFLVILKPKRNLELNCNGSIDYEPGRSLILFSPLELSRGISYNNFTDKNGPDFKATQIEIFAKYCPYECPSSCALPTQKEEKTMQNFIQDTKKEMLIPKNNTSAFHRSKTSARDDRVSAVAIGWLGGVLLAVPFAFLVLSDTGKFCMWFKNYFFKRKNLGLN